MTGNTERASNLAQGDLNRHAMGSRLSTPDATTSDEIQQAEELEALATAEALGETASPKLYRAQPSEVFSVRLPKEAAGELRRLAQSEGVSAGVLLRRWALTALTGDNAQSLTHGQVEQLFRDTLQRAAVEVIGTVADAPRTQGLNLGPRMAPGQLRDRRRA